MFAKKKKEEPIIIQEQEMEKPKPHLVLVDERPIDEYEKLSKELEFKPADLLEQQIKRFLKKHDMRIYNNKEVMRYLRQEAKKIKKVVCWRPLRKKDYDFWQNGKHPYTKIVPLETLKKVKFIEDNFKDKVGFFVSDYESLNPDPFILVTAPDIDTFIFDVWDEPGFTK